jgi:acyl-CoA dehydrogenase
MALTFARFEDVNYRGATRRYFQHIERFSASFALMTDVAMLTLGGYLKKKESLSARLGDVLSSMYLASMVLKHHEDQGSPEEDLPVVEWACRELLYQAQEQLHGVLRNFPVRWLAWAMRLCIFPRGRTYFAPSDRLARTVADLVLAPGPTRTRLARSVYTTPEPGNAVGELQAALELADKAEALEKRLRVEGVKTGRISALDLPAQIAQAEQLGLLNAADAAFLRDYDTRILSIVNVDDFAANELGTNAAP